MNTKLALIALAASAALVGSAHAFIPWVHPEGSATNFDWFNGGSDNGRFGSPVLVGGDTWIFFPGDYRAQSSGGGSSITTDRMSVEIIAHLGQRIEHATPFPTWSYSIVGDGSVSAFSSLIATDLIDGSRTLVNTVNFFSSAPGSGDIHPYIDLDLTQSAPDWTHFNLSWEVTFSATSGPGGSASIEQRVYNMQLPAPGSLALLGIAGLISRRRR
ncbi:MAG: hypothetical protein AABZ53_09500 [Planctomycetota bacterium]